MVTNQEIISGIVDLIETKDGSYAGLRSLLKEMAKIPDAQLDELCTINLPGYPGITPLMGLIAISKTQGVSFLNLFLTSLNPEQRLRAAESIVPTISNSEDTFMQSLLPYQGQNVLTILAKEPRFGGTIKIFYPHLSPQAEQAPPPAVAVPISQEKIESYYYNDIKRFLSSKALLLENQELVEKLRYYPGYEAGLFYGALTYLDKVDLLNQNFLNLCLTISTTPGESEYTWQPPPIYNPQLFKLLNTLNSFKFNVDETELKILFAMKKSDLGRLNKVSSDLNSAGLLDHQSFRLAMQRVSNKLAPLEASEMTKKSRRTANTQRSELKLKNSTGEEVSIFPEPTQKEPGALRQESQMVGGVGIVKKAYSQENTNEERFIIKKLQMNDLDTNTNARREVKYNRLLGHPAYLYHKNNKPRIAAEWVDGRVFKDLGNEEIIKIPFEKRINCLASGLSDLNKLHSQYRVHGDVSSGNFIINLKTDEMRLIDFGSSHKIDQQGVFATNPSYNDPSESSTNDMLRDMYAMGIICAQLFPELYSVDMGRHTTTTIKLIKTELSPSEQAVVNLVDALMNPTRTSRSSSEDALNYCNELSKPAGDMSKETLAEITSSTIGRTTTSAEDVLRGVLRK